MGKSLPRRWALLAGGVAAVLIVAVPLWMGAIAGALGWGGIQGGHMMGSHMGSGSVGGWSWLAVFVWMVSAFVLGVGTVALVLSSTGGNETEDDDQDADTDSVATLREQYVSGELSETEFEQQVERLLEVPDGEFEREQAPDSETELR